MRKGRGSKIRTVSDPSLAIPVEAGYKIAPIQQALHARYGVINVFLPRYWPFHLERSKASYERLVSIDKSIQNLPVFRSNDRLVQDEKMIEEIYEEGISMVINTILSAEYLL